MYYVHVQLKLKSGVTSSIDLEASQGHVLFFLLYWTVVMFFDSNQLTTFLLKVYHRKHERLFFFNFQHWNNFSVLLNEKQVDVFGVWRPERTQMSKHGLNPAKNVTSFCNWNHHRVSARRGPSNVCLQSNCSCKNIFKHLPGAFGTKCLPGLDGSWSALSCLPVLPSRNESTNWQWSSPKPDWSPMLWNLPGR